jgi:glycosyltransferase involved in cell wall biosynthesis
MRIMFANGRRQYPFIQGGDGITLHTLLDYLHRKGNNVKTVGKFNNREQSDKREEIVMELRKNKILLTEKTSSYINYTIPDSYPCVLFSHEYFITGLKKEIESFSPDLIITQLDDSEIVINIAYRLVPKIILYIHDHHPYNYMAINTGSKLDYIIFNSNSTRFHFQHLINSPNSVIYPAIKFNDYIVQKKFPSYITMINPTSEKGGKLLSSIIQSLPEYQFALVSGWRGIEINSFSFPNVSFFAKQIDIRKIYEITKILIIPSQWEEGFGRVAVEAIAARIPVIASKNGGLPEALGPNGFLITNFARTEAWVSAIKSVYENVELQRKMVEDGIRYAKRFDHKLICKEFTELLDSIYRTIII